MPRQKIKVTTTRTKTRVKKKKSSASNEYMQCNICGGTGVVKKRGRRK